MNYEYSQYLGGQGGYGGYSDSYGKFHLINIVILILFR